MAFTSYIVEQPLVAKVIVEGDLNRSEGLVAPAYLQTIATAKKLSRTKLVLFDLTKLKFWDTRGAESILSVIKEINENEPLRAGIFGPTKDNMNYKAAQRLYSEVGAPLIPWSDTEQDLIKYLQKT